MLVAIDGPAGAGKSTVARAAAHALGFAYLDSGAMYRAVALAGDRDPGSLDIAFRGDRVLLDGEDVSAKIRTPEISQLASRRAADPAVRAALLVKQRELLANGDWVAEGRDIGTVVAPDAEVKVYLNADAATRARRRQAERPDIGGDALATDLRVRDESDAARMRPAADAEQIDTTSLEVDDVVSRIEELVQQRHAGSRA
jgi:CMP/dCMP kinase